MPLQNICLENVEAGGKWGVKAYNVRGLKMENVSVHAREGETFRIYNVEDEEK
jgi:predicted phage tail protein